MVDSYGKCIQVNIFSPMDPIRFFLLAKRWQFLADSLKKQPKASNQGLRISFFPYTSKHLLRSYVDPKNMRFKHILRSYDWMSRLCWNPVHEICSHHSMGERLHFWLLLHPVDPGKNL